jgi:hypothetical protein
VEIWEADRTEQRLDLTAGFCEIDGTLKGTEPWAPLQRGDGPIGRAMATRLPVIRKQAARDTKGVLRDGPMVALPVVFDSQVMAVVALYL